MKYYIILSAALAISAVNASAQTKRSTKILDRQVAVENIKATRADDQFFVGMDLRLDCQQPHCPYAGYRVGREQRGSAAHRHQRQETEGYVRQKGRQAISRCL